RELQSELRDRLRAGMDRAELSAEFDVRDNPQAQAWLRAAELGDDHQCLLRRTIRANGRSSAWINGTPATVAQLSELGNLLVEVHGQNEHVRLVGRRRQLELLDQSGDYTEALAAVGVAHERWRSLSEQLQALEQQAALPPAEAEFLRHQHAELKRHALAPEKVAELEQEYRMLANAGDLLQALAAASALLDDDDSGGARLLAQALAQVEPYRELDADLGEAARMLDEALINCQEAATSLRHAADRIDLSPERLEETAATLSQLGGLARKHGVRLEELQALCESMGQRLEQAEGFAGQRERLQGELAGAEAAYRRAAGELSRARGAHATLLAGKVEAVMAELGMQGGRF
ncbi:MAG: DNA repair protein RecN, partial [Anaerolineae bacterium]